MERRLVDPHSLLTSLVEHVRALRAMRKPRTAAKPQQPGCPDCGGVLDDYVYKTGPKTGNAFRGCTRFPACRYRIEQQTDEDRPVYPA